ncbi:MAG: hypothetical protein ACP5M0_14175, partial [Desulfomonilaceae bacterium]
VGGRRRRGHAQGVALGYEETPRRSGAQNEWETSPAGCMPLVCHCEPSPMSFRAQREILS